MESGRSDGLFHRAQEAIPGGVNSPVRSFRAVGRNPLFLVRGEAADVIDADGNRLVDYVLSYGPLIAGHTHPRVVEAVTEAIRSGSSFGAPTEREILMAEAVKARMPSIDLVRMVNSGTEATMSALRLARAHTGRSRIVKFAGAYHGHADSLLVKAGSGAATLGVPDSPGVNASVAQDTLTLPFNDREALLDLFRKQGGEIAAVIVEPVPGNMGVVPPRDGFLESLREVTAESGALLIFDEVMTGFRVGPGGAQERMGIRPDLTCLGKVIGGGLPVGAYGGRRDIMERVAPLGPVYQAGTLSGNPLAMAAGLATLSLLDPQAYTYLERLGARLEEGLRREADRSGVPVTVNRVGSMLTLFFSPGPVTDWDSAAASDRERYAAFFRHMLDAGIYLPPSQFEAWFLSTAHTEEGIDRTVAAAGAAFSAL